MRMRTLRLSLMTSHVLVSLIPLGFVALIVLLFIIQGVRDDFRIKIGMLGQGVRGQIQLFMDQPRTALQTLGRMLADTPHDPGQITRLLDTHVADSLYFESIFLLDGGGKVVNAGLSPEQESSRSDLLGIDLGHKRQFKTVNDTGTPQWSDTFLSLSSGKVSLTLYVPAGMYTLAADINLNALAQLISRLSRDKVVTMVIDRNGAIIIHPDRELMGKSIMMNDIPLVVDALQGNEKIEEFSFRGRRYFGSTSIIEPTGWVCLIAEPTDHLARRLIIPLLIFVGGLCGTVLLSLLLAWFKARQLARPLVKMTEQSAVIAGGDYTQTLTKSNYYELAQLADSINGMIAAIQQREFELRDNELKYRELVENTSNLVLRLDHDFRITYANHTLKRLTGVAADLAIGMFLAEVMEEDDWQAIKAAADSWNKKKPSSTSFETRLHHLDGTFRYLLMTINMHYDGKGSMLDMNIIGHDITARYEFERKQREMEQQRQQSLKMELLGLMAGGVAHDLNNILSGIINYPELLLLRLPEDSPHRPALQAIKKSGERAAAVVADLLTVARESAAVHTVTDINRLVTDYTHSPEFQKLRQFHPGVRFDFLPQTDLWFCRCSPIHIEKAVMNLVINAFEATGDEGRVTFSTDNITPAQIATLVPELKAGRYLRLRVGDTGKGIDARDLDRIFEPFFSKKDLGRSGTGLGLTVAWNTVREHGGIITVDSGPMGTAFSIYLPATGEELSEKLEKDELSELFGKGEHILIVDDEEQLREVAVHMLEMLQYHAIAVGSGEEALRYLKSGTADLVLLDMQMDPGMNGKETYEKICLDHPGQKAIIASGFSKSRDIDATISQGAGSFIKKPYSITELGQAVQRTLHDGQEPERHGDLQPDRQEGGAE